MKIKVLLIAVLAFRSLFVHGQNKIQGSILDKQTSEPLSYATIAALHQSYGSYTDASGLFTLYFINESDSLKVSYLGYKNSYTTVLDLKKSGKIFLEPNPVQLNTVVIRNKKIKGKEMEIGFFTKKPNPFMNPNYSINVYATYIPFPEKGRNVLIKSVKFTYKMKTKNFPLRVHILTSTANGEPGDDIVAENIVFNNYIQEHEKFGTIAIIDIAKYNVFMPHNGIFIGLEWIDFERTPVAIKQALENGPIIGVIKTHNSAIPDWVNGFNQSKWRKFLIGYSLAIGLTVVNYSD